MSKVKILEGFEPRITMTYETMTKIKAIVDLCDTEVGFVGLVQKSGANTYNIYDVFVPKQEAHGATCEIAPDALLDIGQALLEGEDGVEKVNQLRYWGHSHNTMSTHPSGQDDKQALEFLEDADYLIRHIVNKKDEYNLTFYDFKNGFEYTDLELEIINPEEVTQLLERIDMITEQYTQNAEKYAKEMKDNVSIIYHKTFIKTNKPAKVNVANQYNYTKQYRDYYNYFDTQSEYTLNDNIFWTKEQVLQNFTDDEVVAIAFSQTVFDVIDFIGNMFQTSYADAKELQELCMELVDEGVVEYEV